VPNVEEDHQNEIVGNQFIPKSSGVFDIYVEVGFVDKSITTPTDIHIHVFINGKKAFPVAARTLGGIDNFIFGTGVAKFEKGDKVDLRLKMFGSKDYNARLIRVRYAKIS